MSDQMVPPEQRVVVEEPEKQNLLGLLMKDLLATNLSEPSNYRRIESAEGDIRIQAADMAVTMRLGGGKITILRTPSERPRSTVRGTMAALLGVVTGKGLVAPFVTGAIKISGDPLFLLKVLPLIRAPEEAPIPAQGD